MDKQYADFLAGKALRAQECGLQNIPQLASHLFPFQRHCVEFALRVGNAGNFLSTGLGKTACELEWSIHAAQATNGKALILAPLSVGWQIAKEGERWGYPAHVIRDKSEATPIKGADLFGMVDMSATGIHDVKRKTATSRAKAVADVVSSSPNEPWVIWVDTDYEADAIRDFMPDIREIRGSHTPDQKEETLRAFADGTVRALLTKPSLTGYGLNWQHCARTAFVGRSFSYEAWYQAVRRFWRFGQKRQVEVHLIVAEGEDAIARVIDRKSKDHIAMKAAMRAAMIRSNGKEVSRRTAYLEKHKARVPTWAS